MPYLLLILGVAGLLGLLLWWFATTEPRKIIRTVTVAVPLMAAALLIFLAVKGWLGLLFGALTLALPWIGRLMVAGRLYRRVKTAMGPSPGKGSFVQTAYLSMRLDHDSGAMSGEVRRGRFTGAGLDALGEPELRILAAEVTAEDPKGVPVLEAYLDWRLGPDWRQTSDDAQREPNGDAGDASARRRPGGMSREDAYRILGLEPGADADAVRQAHHRLIQALHPDHGGSAHLTAQINAAKDVLLG